MKPASTALLLLLALPAPPALSLPPDPGADPPPRVEPTVAGPGPVIEEVGHAGGGPVAGAGPAAESGPVAQTGPAQILVTFAPKPGRRLQRAGTSRQLYGRAGSYRTSPRTSRLAARLARDYGLQQVAEWPIPLLDVHCVVYELPPDGEVEATLGRLAADPRVDSAQPMQLFEVLATAYDDPYLHLQHSIDSLQVDAAHRWALGRGVRVAVVDSGVDVEHPDLEGRIWLAENFTGRRSPGFTADVHGTAVAGIIASTAGNGIGIVGVAPDVKILALKACWEETGTARAHCDSFTLAQAISVAAERGADVLNLSLAGPADPLLERLLRAAMARGLVVVAASPGPAAAGGFPSDVDGVLLVAAAGPRGGYDFLSGSSFAAAHVSGITALLLERRPRLDARSLRSLLADDVPVGSTLSPARKLGEAAGGGPALVNACRALARLVGETGCPPPAPAPASGAP